jgi:hypothetical protein
MVLFWPPGLLTNHEGVGIRVWRNIVRATSIQVSGQGWNHEREQNEQQETTLALNKANMTRWVKLFRLSCTSTAAAAKDRPLSAGIHPHLIGGRPVAKHGASWLDSMATSVTRTILQQAVVLQHAFKAEHMPAHHDTAGIHAASICCAFGSGPKAQRHICHRVHHLTCSKSENFWGCVPSLRILAPNKGMQSHNHRWAKRAAVPRAACLTWSDPDQSTACRRQAAAASMQLLKAEKPNGSGGILPQA